MSVVEASETKRSVDAASVVTRLLLGELDIDGSSGEPDAEGWTVEDELVSKVSDPSVCMDRLP